jgi:hypothetical protein
VHLSLKHWRDMLVRAGNSTDTANYRMNGIFVQGSDMPTCLFTWILCLGSSTWYIDDLPEHCNIGNYFLWSCKPVLYTAQLQIVVNRCQIRCY